MTAMTETIFIKRVTSVIIKDSKRDRVSYHVTKEGRIGTIFGLHSAGMKYLTPAHLKEMIKYVDVDQIFATMAPFVISRLIEVLPSEVSVELSDPYADSDGLTVQTVRFSFK